MFQGKGVLKICRKFTGEHPCRSAISIKLLCNFIGGLILGSSLSDSVGTTWIDRMHVEASYHHMLSSMQKMSLKQVSSSISNLENHV